MVLSFKELFYVALVVTVDARVVPRRRVVQGTESCLNCLEHELGSFYFLFLLESQQLHEMISGWVGGRLFPQVGITVRGSFPL